MSNSGHVFPSSVTGEARPKGGAGGTTRAPAMERKTDPKSLSCWVVTDGKAGMINQCVGLAEALGADFELKRVRLRTPWRDLTPFFRLGGRLQLSSESDSLAPPWPDLLIATGRHSIAASILVRRLSR